jgi:hypothetical protein
VLRQFGGGVNPRTDSDDVGSYLAGRSDILGRISDEAHAAVRAQKPLGLPQPVFKHFFSQLTMIGEATKLEIVCQPGRPNLHPSDRFEVTRAYAQELVSAPQGFKDLPNTRHESGREKADILCGVTSGDFQRLGHPAVDDLGRHTDAFQHGPKDAHIGFAMKSDSVDRRFNPVHLSHGTMQCIAMRPVVAPQQGAVDIEEIGIIRMPTESGWLCLICHKFFPNSFESIFGPSFAKTATRGA